MLHVTKCACSACMHGTRILRRRDGARLNRTNTSLLFNHSPPLPSFSHTTSRLTTEYTVKTEQEQKKKAHQQWWQHAQPPGASPQPSTSRRRTGARRRRRARAAPSPGRNARPLPPRAGPTRPRPPPSSGSPCRCPS